MDSLITNLDLFVILKSQGSSLNHEALFEIVLLTKSNLNLSEEYRDTLKEFCRRFTRAATDRWKKSQRNRKTEKFRTMYGSWLEANIDWPSCFYLQLAHASTSSDLIPLLIH